VLHSLLISPSLTWWEQDTKHKKRTRERDRWAWNFRKLHNEKRLYRMLLRW
jgi:hypothetical protein